MDTTLNGRTLPARRRLDVGAYYRMAEVGILTRDDRVELIDGEIIDMTPIGSAHAGKTNRLSRLVARAVAEGFALVSVQSPLRLDSYNEPEPDLMLLRPRADDYQLSHPTAGDVLLLVEFADSSLAYDRGIKLALYARHGVPEVWIVDIVNGVVEVFLEPGDSSFAVQEQWTDGVLTPRLIPAVAIDVKALLA